MQPGPGKSLILKDLAAFIRLGAKRRYKGSLGQPIGIFPSQAVNVYGPTCGNYQVWMRRIKKAFDPNVASDPAFYIEP